MFKPVSSQVDFSALEEEVLKFWKESDIFSRSLENRKGKERFVFYEGPPTANGKPHLGHVLQRSLKDLFVRYKTMQGFLVERRAGWDTHGLPVELEIEKELGLKGKTDILTLKENEFESIKYFNELCKNSVFKYIDNWVDLTDRVGFWIDFSKAYVTCENDYIESIWWFLSECNKKDLLYQDYKVVPYCPRCETSLSSHELSEGYKDDIEDPSVYIKFELEEEFGTYFLVWTTTPWTLPGNVALAVGKNIKYVKVKHGEEKYILAEKRLEVLDGKYEILEALKADELIGKSYKPLYPYLNPQKKAYFVVEADFASEDDGTGIVHTAVMYGVDDFELGKKHDLPMKHTVDIKGLMTPEVEKFAGLFVKKADPEIIKDLEERKLMYKSGVIKHTYPFCWRCSTPLLYYALEAWFLKTTAVKKELIENNNQINWMPETIKKGRMGNWLETLIDWNISRNRFWGTPLPIWVCKNKHIMVIGSRDELKDLGTSIPDDLHRPFIDEITFDCSECKEKMNRVPYVADVWMDSGAMPFAQWHYPFENEKEFKEWYPADYIVEGIDQTRGWFYLLMAEAMLMGSKTPAPFKNVITTGFILDEKGLKMSKSKKNVVDPWDVIPITGADTVRWYMFGNMPPGGNSLFSIDIIKEKQRRFTLILWNCYKFFLEHAIPINWSCELKNGEMAVLDKWILSKLTELILTVNKNMDKYDYIASSKLVESFVVNDFSTWYIRRSRDRVGPEADEKDRNTSLSVMYGVLVGLTKLLAPFMPFISESMYRNLTGDLSVHLTDYPKGDQSLLDKELMEQMSIARKVVEVGHSKRKQANVKLRQPLSSVVYKLDKKLDKKLEEVIAEELNVKSVEYEKSSSNNPIVDLNTNITPELKLEGDARDLIRQIQQLRKENNLTLADKTSITAPDWPEKFEKLILKSTLSVSMKKGEQVGIDVVSKS